MEERPKILGWRHLQLFFTSSFLASFLKIEESFLPETLVCGSCPHISSLQNQGSREATSWEICFQEKKQGWSEAPSEQGSQTEFARRLSENVYF
jgi:hypothetical protein